MENTHKDSKGADQVVSQQTPQMRFEYRKCVMFAAMFGLQSLEQFLHSDIFDQRKHCWKSSNIRTFVYPDTMIYVHLKFSPVI